MIVKILTYHLTEDFRLTRGDLFCYLTILLPTQDDLSTVPYDERCK